MEHLRLNFDTEIQGRPRTFVVEVPYVNGMVATSEFGPKAIYAESPEIAGAFRGEPLDKFMDHCKMQLLTMSKITEAETDLDRHIGALMAVVMDAYSRNRKILYGDLLLHIDCFSLLLKAAGFDPEEIRRMYPRITNTILDLYPNWVLRADELSAN